MVRASITYPAKFTVYSKQLPHNKISTFDWNERPQRDRRRRDSSEGESTVGNSSSGSFAPYYRNPYFSSLEEDYEHDEMMFKAAGVDLEPDEFPLEASDSEASVILDDIDWEEDEIAFRAAGVNLYDDVSATTQERVASVPDAGWGELGNRDNLTEEKAQAETEIAEEVLAGALMGDFNDFHQPIVFKQIQIWISSNFR